MRREDGRRLAGGYGKGDAMKKGVLVLALAILLVSAAVYGKEKEKEDEGRHGEADILGKADPDRSLLGFGWFDGKEGSCGYYYESRYSILKELKAVKAVPASDFTPEKMTYPVYAFEIGGTDHFFHTFFWTNGYLITKDGQAWRFDYNFEKLKAKAFDSKAEPRPVKSISDLPNGFYLTKPGGKWDPTRLTRSESVTEPEDVSLTVSSRLDPQINLRLENTGKELWSYGEAYWLEVQIGGDWYNVPPAMPDGLAFISIGYGLEAGASRLLTVSLSSFGTLPDGHYRVCKSIRQESMKGGTFTLCAEFSVPQEIPPAAGSEACHETAATKEANADPLLQAKEVIRIDVRHLPESASMEYHFSEKEQIRQITDYLSGLHLISDYPENPDHYSGGTWVITLSHADGSTQTIYHFGNMFIRSEEGPWYKMSYEEASRFDILPEEATASDPEKLKAEFPQYFGLQAGKGLEVYIWPAESLFTYRCVITGGTNRMKILPEITALPGLNLSQAKVILDSYKIKAEDVFIYFIGNEWAKRDVDADYWATRAKELEARFDNRYRIRVLPQWGQ